MKNPFKKKNNDLEELKEENTSVNETNAAPKKKRFGVLRASLVFLLAATFICGIVYPLSVTLVAQAMFPYEANGSQIVVTLKDGTQRTYGSELIGQQYEEPIYFFGRVNTGAPSNLDPTSDEYKELLQTRVKERKEKLAEIGYTETSAIPAELLTASGSGLDPHISPDTAKYQIDIVYQAREKANATDSSINKYSKEELQKIIDRYTENRFLFAFGEKTVNVLLVNLALDGLVESGL